MNKAFQRCLLFLISHRIISMPQNSATRITRDFFLVVDRYSGLKYITVVAKVFYILRI
jgi:hypothetical protein